MLVSVLFLLKVLFLTICIIVLRGTLPRYRIDYLLNDTWKEWLFFILATLLLFNFLLAGFFI